MPQFKVSTEVTLRGTVTVEAESAADAKALVNGPLVYGHPLAEDFGVEWEAGWEMNGWDAGHAEESEED